MTKNPKEDDGLKEILKDWSIESLKDILTFQGSPVLLIISVIIGSFFLLILDILFTYGGLFIFCENRLKDSLTLFHQKIKINHEFH